MIKNFISFYCRRIVNSLPDKGQRLRNAITEIEKLLATPSSPMDCETMINQFKQMIMPSNEDEASQTEVHLMKPITKSDTKTSDFSDERLNEVKQRLKARQAERNSKATTTTAKLLSLDEVIRLYNEEKKRQEVKPFAYTSYSKHIVLLETHRLFIWIFFSLHMI